MTSRSYIIRGSIFALLIITVAAGVGFGAPGGSQTVTVTAAGAIGITVPGAAAIASTTPGDCGATSTTVNVASNKAWNLQIRASSSYPNGKPKNGSTEMENAFQYKGGSMVSFANITTTYANLFNGNQGKTKGTDVAVDYQQCVDYLDDPAVYTIVVEYLGTQP